MSLGAVFPGQGSQTVGMSQFLYDEFSVAREVFEEASDSLLQDFKKLLFDGPESDLMLTENTQPAILLSSYVTFKVLSSIAPVKVAASAGHSIGEYGAVVTSGALDFASAMKTVRVRGQEMQKAVPAGKGGMAALMGATPEQAHEICEWAKKENPSGGSIEPANFNAPGQIVLSGHQIQVEFVTKNAKPEILANSPKKLRFIPLKVSAPFHCSLMAPAQEAMKSVLGGLDFKDASFPVIQNIDAKEHTLASELRDNLVGQISAPVLWIDCVQGLKAKGIDRLVEFGNGKVLAGLIKKIEPEMQVLNINSLDDLKQAEAALN